MAVSVNKMEGVTVVTVASNPQNPCPPLCQVLCGLCYNPLCCVVSETLKTFQGGSQYILGTVHIMVGLLNIGLGVELVTCSSPYPFWLGSMFILFGTVAILSEKIPSPCLIILNVVLNLFGVLFALAAIVLYSIDLAIANLHWLCGDDDDYGNSDRDYSQCLAAKEMLLRLARSVTVLLIVLAVLELCVTISCAVMGIKALKNSAKTRSKGSY